MRRVRPHVRPRNGTTERSRHLARVDGLVGRALVVMALSVLASMSSASGAANGTSVGNRRSRGADDTRARRIEVALRARIGTRRLRLGRNGETLDLSGCGGRLEVVVDVQR